jgi:hypothetical protein
MATSTHEPADETTPPALLPPDVRGRWRWWAYDQTAKLWRENERRRRRAVLGFLAMGAIEVVWLAVMLANHRVGLADAAGVIIGSLFIVGMPAMRFWLPPHLFARRYRVAKDLLESWASARGFMAGDFVEATSGVQVMRARPLVVNELRATRSNETTRVVLGIELDVFGPGGRHGYCAVILFPALLSAHVTVARSMRAPSAAPRNVHETLDRAFRVALAEASAG